MTNAVVVGSGPNGLAAALTLADAGVQVHVVEAAETLGGGTRSSELTVPGVVHDECSGFHPLAVDTPFSRHFDLAAHGLTWMWADVQYSHPLDGGSGAAAYLSVEQTAAGLGSDGAAWSRVFGKLDERFGDITEDFFQPMLHVPEHPLKLGRFGYYSSQPVTLNARRWSTDEGRALWAGVAAHAMRPFATPMSSAIGIALGTAAHTYGWPVAEGGSQAIADAMVSKLRSLGATFETGRRVTTLDELDPADVVLFDLNPAQVADVAGSRLSRGVARALRRYRHGPGSFKVEFAVDGEVPWLHEESRRAGTLHLGGSFEEIATTERQVARGEMPERPFVLAGQQWLADPSRSAGGIKPFYAYAHVPHGYAGDATAAIEAQIERFAPGFRDRVVAKHVRSVADMQVHNPNYVGGDVVTGANTPRQLLFRPRFALDPYSLGTPGLYICSAATPPGGGAHGMCGWNAAHAALAHL